MSGRRGTLARQGRLSRLVGTSGVGKSRVAHEFVDTLRQKDWQVLEAECNPLEQAVPYSLLKKLLQSVLQVGDIGTAHLRCGPRWTRRPHMPISGRQPFARFSTSPSAIPAGTISNPCCGGA